MYAQPPPGSYPSGLEGQHPQMYMPEQQQQNQMTPVILGMRKPKAPAPTNPTRTLYVRNLNESMNHNRRNII